MSIDPDLLAEFKAELADRYTAEELAEFMGLDVWDLLEADTLQDKLVELKFR